MYQFLRRHGRLLIAITCIGASLVFYNSCGEAGFKPFKSQDLASHDITGPQLSSLEQGKLLYSTNCSSCHGDLAASNKAGRSPYQIDQAIKTLSYMNPLTTLSADQIAMISEALGYNPNTNQMCKGRRVADPTAAFRLTRQEYANTVADLFGAPASVTNGFPPDNDGERFANNASALANVSPELLEQYVYASEAVVAHVMANNKALIFTCNVPTTSAGTCASQIVDRWGLRILRRPLLLAERTQLLTFIEQTPNVTPAVFEAGVQTAIKALLVSPYFIFRTLDRGSAATKILDDYEFATRLSYFLWSSTPDDELLEAARLGTIKSQAGLRAQIARMLASPKARRLSDDFASRWFGVHRLQFFTPSSTVYPAFSASLKTAMATETKLFFDNIVSKNLRLDEVLTANYSFLNQELATHYGVAGVSGAQFRQVDMSSTARRGVVSHGSVLLLTSHPDDSSIVLRGKWVMENFLCDPPPPPPANVPAPPPIGGAIVTKRQRTEAHRNNPACFSCHAKMDPIGFGLENFDGAGGFRTTLNNMPIDAAGTMPNGQSFTGAGALANHLTGTPAFNKCVSEKMISYAVGRNLASGDDCNVEDVATQIVNTSTLADTIEAIVRSDLFMKVEGK